MSGYTHCACRDCMDTTVSSDTSRPELCDECRWAGCMNADVNMDGYQYECQRNSLRDHFPGCGVDHEAEA